MAYTQEQINAALVAELAARPNTPQADLAAYAKATYGLSDAQISNAYSALNQATQPLNQAGVAYTAPEAAAYNAYRSGDIAGVNRAVQEGRLTAAQAKANFGLTDAEIAYMANTAGVKFYPPTSVTNRYAAGAVVNADGSVKVGNKTYTAAEAALYNAYLDGNMAEFNRLTALNKFTLPDMQAKFGLTDADMAWITNNAGGQFYNQAPIKKTNITGVINTIGGVTPPTQTAPVGQFRELFPSFAESQRLAGQMVANRPTTENIISMINSNSARPVTVGGVNYSAPESAAYNAYISGNIPEFNRLTQANQLTAPAMQSKFLLSDADMAYITGNRGGVFYNPTGTQQIAPTSLNNVLSMISK
jgi:hypothetical protein